MERDRRPLLPSLEWMDTPPAVAREKGRGGGPLPRDEAPGPCLVELIRHAPAPGNLERRYLGSTDEELAPQGIALARRNARPPEELPERVWCSPMRRCLSTARLLYPGLEPEPVADLRESGFGAFEYGTYEELQGDPAYRAWVESGGMVPPPGGEGREEFQARCAAAFCQVAGEILSSGTKRGAIVTHGGVIMALCAAMALPEKDFYQWQSPCCGGWIIALEPERWERNKKFVVLGAVRPGEEEP